MEAAQTLADVTTAYLLNAQTRTDLMEASERAVHNSLHDTLTGLPNRTLLIQRLDHASGGQPGALLVAPSPSLVAQPASTMSI